MTEHTQRVAEAAAILKSRVQELERPAAVLQSPELKALYAAIASVPSDERAAYGAAVNALKQELIGLIEAHADTAEQLPPIDVTAPFDVNTPFSKRPRTLPAENGTVHPIMSELDRMLDIFSRMGFTAVESRQIDDDFHMFGSLNFPEGHPARDDYDTFVTTDIAPDGRPFVAPAHTSTMQHRVLSEHKASLDAGRPIAMVVPGRVFRNEDLDARHEHTFYQLEGIYVDRGVTVGNLMATLKVFMTEYYQQDIEIKTQPFYFPFTEPSFEFAVSCPFCKKAGCHVCGEGWIELLGCGMIHPNVLKAAGIDPVVYTGFAWGIGFMRMVMIKYGIEDIRHFSAGKLEFLRQFK